MTDELRQVPLEEYRKRLGTRRQAVARHARLERSIAWARLVVFVSGAALAWTTLRSSPRLALWLIAPVVAFVGLVIVHARVIARRRRAESAIQHYQDGLARMEDRAPERSARGDRFRDDAHCYAADLDLFGAGSLFERLSTARTAVGEETLAAWLLAPASESTIVARQQAVRELAPLLDLKEALALLGADVRAEVPAEKLTSWAVASPVPVGRRATIASGSVLGAAARSLASARLVAAAAGAACFSAAAAWAFGLTGGLPFVITLALGAIVTLPMRPLVRAVLVGVDHRSGELKTLALLLAQIEHTRFHSPALMSLRASLDTSTESAGHALPPSQAVARLSRLVDLLESRRNLMAIIVAPLFWTTQLALAVESWRRSFGPSVVRWLNAVGEIEALAALSTFAYEHPEYPFPGIAAVGQGRSGQGREHGPTFEAAALGHPLLPARGRVTNDVAIGHDGHPSLLLVSGSNMSGKSTLLRTVGVNAVLALAGAPVCAASMRISPLAIGATLAISDSLQRGRSRFYAEITRLRQILDLTAGPLPVLFLLDEMLSGTNSHDRRIGAEAVIRSLLSRGSIGLATTHDLALADIADSLGGTAANVHFEDSLDGGTISFDYKMRPGVIRKGNALALMRAVGLDIGPGPETQSRA